MANATDRGDDVTKYTALFNRLKVQYHTFYFNASSHSYGVSITANVLPLYLDIVPEVRCAFFDRIYTHGCHWFPHLLASSEQACDQWHSSWVATSYRSAL